jgi:fumarate reductase flavoprotein subunit
MSNNNESCELYDVVVVGGGGAGMAAAVSAAQNGARVAVIEKNQALGGTTAMSIGSMTASLTTLQYRAGVYDDHDSHFADMPKFAPETFQRDNLELRRVYVENSGPTLEWLRSLGVVFFGPMPEPPHERPRMHNVLPNSGAYTHYLGKAARKLGTKIMLATRAVELIIEDGTVTGVRTEHEGQKLALMAKGGVILAAGDFSSNTELKQEFIGDLAAHVPGINKTSTGDGITLGISAGGRVVNADLALGPEFRFAIPEKKLLLQRIPPNRLLTFAMEVAVRWMPDPIMRPFIMQFATVYLSPNARLFRDGAILINKSGERFTDELAKPWMELPGQPDGRGYIVFDGEHASMLTKWPKFISTAPGVAYAFLKDYQRNRRDIFNKSDTVAGLAEKLQVSSEALSQSVAKAEKQSGTSWKPPYVALGPVYSWIVITEGGLAVDTTTRVLADDDNPILGLYAVGSNGQGGLLLEGHGNHVGWGMISGRLAGAAAAKRAK